MFCDVCEGVFFRLELSVDKESQRSRERGEKPDVFLFSNDCFLIQKEEIEFQRSSLLVVFPLFFHGKTTEKHRKGRTPNCGIILSYGDQCSCLYESHKETLDQCLFRDTLYSKIKDLWNCGYQVFFPSNGIVFTVFQLKNNKNSKNNTITIEKQ